MGEYSGKKIRRIARGCAIILISIWTDQYGLQIVDCGMENQEVASAIHHPHSAIYKRPAGLGEQENVP